MSESINFSVKSDGDFDIVKIMTENATINIAQSFRDGIFALVEKGRNKIIVDLSIAELMDSTFLGALVVAFRKCKDAGGTIVLVEMRESVALTFGLTKLINVFDVYKTIGEAEQALSR